jgi:hypothetical protein
LASEESDEFLDEDIDERAEDKATENDKRVEWGRLFTYVRTTQYVISFLI